MDCIKKVYRNGLQARFECRGQWVIIVIIHYDKFRMGHYK